MTPEERKRQFDEQGYTLQRGFLSPEEVAALLAALREAQQAAADSHLDRHGMTFKHNLWRFSPKLRDFLASPKIVHFLRDVAGPDFWIRWDQTIEKKPGGAAFPWHQDNGYNGLLDMHYQFWIALTPMDVDNGGLWLQPGSHKLGKIPHSYDGSHAFNNGDETKAVLLPAQPGDALVFSSLMLHKTNANITKDRSRLAYVIEFMRLGEVDPFIEPPFFVVARGGEPAPAMVQRQPGSLSPRNQLKYFVPRLRRGVANLRRRLATMLGGKAGSPS
ncbi:MAG: phytanoyl-CoA dioxygenase family protein [Planctomycetes bacterium]|nr:phytanoyl-CoA dioxygenase family protein [Planctomycetota bacterium]